MIILPQTDSFDQLLVGTERSYQSGSARLTSEGYRQKKISLEVLSADCLKGAQ
jgi:hypothetical protein